MITVSDTDIHHWFWRLRTLADSCPDLPQALLAGTLAASLRREVVGLYVGRLRVQVPEDLALAVFDCLQAMAARRVEGVEQDLLVLSAALAA